MAPELTAMGAAGPGGSALQTTGLSKTFGANLALAGVDISVDAGEVRCLVGGNGSGKSTLIKIISGYHVPDPGGEVRIGGEVLNSGHPKASHALGARFVHQDLGLVADATVTENVFLGSTYPTRFGMVRDGEARRRCAEALAALDLDVDPRASIADLSPAQRTGVAIARAVRNEDSAIRLLVLDEPTATLPAAEVGSLLRMVRSVAATGVGVLYVTHRLDEVFEIGDRVTVLRNGHEIVTTPASALSRQALLELIVGEEVTEVQRDHVTDAETAGRLQQARAHRPVLRVRGLAGAGVETVSLDVAPGEVVGVSGVTGSGREQFNALMFGATTRRAGTVEVDGVTVLADSPGVSIRSGMAFLPSDRRTHSGLMSLPAVDNLTITALADFWSAPSMRRRDEEKEAAKWFDRLSLHPAGAWGEPLSSFSGGNQQKVLLAKWLRLGPRVLLLDEPTQGVDVAATAEIYRQLLSAAADGACVVVATSNVDELVALCSRVVVFDHGRLVAELDGADLNVGTITSWSLGGNPSGQKAGAT